MDSDGAVPCPATSTAWGTKEVIANICRLVNAAKESQSRYYREEISKADKFAHHYY